MAAEAVRLRALRDRLMDGMAARLDGVFTNGGMARRVPGNLNLKLRRRRRPTADGGDA